MKDAFDRRNCFDMAIGATIIMAVTPAQHVQSDCRRVRELESAQ
jgi:hypothetical protein